MVMISLGAEAEVDILSSGEFHTQHDELKRILKANRSSEDMSVHKTIPISAQWVSDPLELDFGDAPAGCMWIPLWLTVCGATDTQVLAGTTTAVYFGGDTSSPSLANLLIPGTAATQVPFNQQLGGKDAIYGHFGDHFMAFVHGAPAVGQNIIGILRVREVHPAAVEELNTL